VLGFCITLNTTYIIQSYLSSLVLYGELLNSELRLQKHFRENVVAEDSQNDLSSEDEELDGPVETEKEVDSTVEVLECSVLVCCTFLHAVS